MPGPAIKIGVQADQASFRSVETSLKSLISTVEKLNVAMGNVGKTLSTINTGGRSGPADIKQQISGKGKGIVGSILGSDDSASMNKMTQSVDQAFGKIENRIKAFVSSVSAQVKGLNGSIGSINVPTGGATAVSGGGGFSGYSYNYGGGAVGGGGGGRIISSGGGIISSGGGGGGGGVAPTPTGPQTPSKQGSLPGMDWRQRAAGALLGGATGSMFGGMGGALGAAAGATTDGLFGGASRFLAPAMGPIGIGLAAAGLYNKVATSWEDVRLGRSDYTIQKPFMEYSAMGATAAPFASLYKAAVGGGVGHVWATDKVLSDEKIRKSMADEKARKEIIGLQTKMEGNSVRNVMARGGSKLQATVADVAQNAISGNVLPSSFVSSIGMPIFAMPGQNKTAISSGMSDLEAKTLKEIEFAQATLAAPAKQTSEMAGAVEAQKLVSARFIDLAEDIYGNAMSRHRTMISMGSSTGTMKIKDASGKQIEVDKYWYKVAKLNERGWTEGDDIAGYGALKGIGLGYESQLKRTQVVSLGMAGLTNADQLVKMGGMLGGSVGAGGSFLNKTVQGSIGLGGLDVAVGRELFGSMSGNLFGTGGFTGGGGAAASYMAGAAGLVGGALSGGGVAFDVSQQQVRMAALTQGTPVINDYGSGRTAGIYQVGNILSGVRSAGGFGMESEIYSTLPTELLLGILKDPDVKTDADLPAGLRANGITLDGIRNRVKDIHNAPFINMPNLKSSSGKDTEGSILLSQMHQSAISGGRASDPVVARLAGLKGKDFWKERQRLVEVGGMGLGAQGKGFSTIVGEGVMEAAFLGDERLNANVQGKGVGTAAPKGSEATAIQKQSAITLHKAIESATGEYKKQLQAAFDKMPEAAKAAAMALDEVGATDFGNLDGIVKGLNTHLTAFSEWVKNKSGKMSSSNQSPPKTAAPQQKAAK